MWWCPLVWLFGFLLAAVGVVVSCLFGVVPFLRGIAWESRVFHCVAFSMFGWAVTSLTVTVAEPADWIIADVAVPPPAECAVGHGILPASTAPQLQSCDAVASLRFVFCAARRWCFLVLAEG